MKKFLLRVILLSAVVGAAWGSYRFFQQMPQRQQEIPTTRVKQGDVIVRSFARGELRAVRSVTLTAPNLFGTVQVTRLAVLGAFAREKDLVVEFDDAEVRSRLEEKQLELDQIDEQYRKAEADLAIRNNQDQVELLRARYSVRRAELEVKRNELLSPIDAQKNVLTLDETRRRLKQLESDIQSRREQGQAEIAVLRERKQKAVLELNREKQRLNQVKLLTPISGLVAIKQNMGGSMRMMGTQMPEIREGDQVQPGMPVADVLDVSELEIIAKVGELDRANLKENQEVHFVLDAAPEQRFSGVIKALSGTASANVMSSDPAKKFDVTFSVDMKQLLTGLGASPQQIQKILATAEQNRKRPGAAFASSSLMSGGAGMFGGAMPGGMPGGAPGDGSAGAGGMPAMMAGPGGSPGQGQGGFEGGRGQRGGGQGGAGGRAFGGGNMSDEDRTKMRDLMQKELGGRNMQDLSPEDRQKIFEKIRGSIPGVGARPQAAAGAAGAAGARPEGQEKKPGGVQQPGESAPAEQAGAREGGEGRARRGGEGGEGRGRRGGGAGAPGMMMFAGPAPQFSEKEMAAAQLPPPPEDDAGLEVLLRPGLLADVEIIVEKIPNAIYVPVQAIFEKDGNPVVYIRTANRLEPRVVKLSKRSESLMVVAAGLKPGELVALSNPDAKKKDKKDEKPGGGPNPMGGMPGPGGR